MGVNVYIHIPFCSSKCLYCHFISFKTNNDVEVDEYIDFLYKEIIRINLKGNQQFLNTLYFGGGTPGILTQNQLKKIFDILKKKLIFTKNTEITIEANPKDIIAETLALWEKLGINRISIGVQTLNKKSLKEIGRNTKGDIFQALDTIYHYYQSNTRIPFIVSLDFIIGLPYVKEGEIKKNIETLLTKYDFINHISVYILEMAKYPEFWQNISINEKDYLQEYLEIKKYFKKAGFLKYEISNFAKNGYKCKHNCGYWKHKNYLGFGVSAHSFVNGIRFSNSEKLSEYYAWKGKKSERLGREDLFLEKMMFDLRTSGISLKDATKLNQEKIKRFLGGGYLKQKKEKIVLSDKGVVILDYILSEII